MGPKIGLHVADGALSVVRYSLFCAHVPQMSVPVGRGGHELFSGGTQHTKSPQSAQISTCRLRGGMGRSSVKRLAIKIPSSMGRRSLSWRPTPYRVSVSAAVETRGRLSVCW